MPTVPTSNTVTMTVNLDKTASLSKGYVGAQGDSITFTVVVPAGLSASGYDAYIDFIQPDGLSYFKGPYDCSTGTFNFSIGVSDSLMDKDGDLHWQFILATTVGDVRTVKWTSLKYKTKVYESVGATSSAVLPYVPQMVFPTAYPAANVSVASGRFIGTTVEDALTEIDAILREVVIDPRAYGAVGDGVTDDTAAMQDAIDAAVTLGVPLQLMDTYLIEDSLVVKTGLRIYGKAGKLVTSATYLFLNNTAIEDVLLSDIHATNLGAAGGGSDSAVFMYTDEAGGGSCVQSRFINNIIIGFGMGFSVKGSATTIDMDINTQFASIVGTNGFNLIQGNTIRDSLATIRIGTGGGHAIYVRSGYFRVLGNLIINMQGGILGAIYGVVSQNVVINAYLDNGIYMAGANGLSVTGNYVENTYADNIAINGGLDVSVVGNILIGSSASGIRLQDTHNFSIIGNTILNPANHFIKTICTDESPTSGEGIISGNNFKSTSAMGGNAIFIDAPVAPYVIPANNISIVDNSFDGIDTTLLGTAFYGPFAIINVKGSATGVTARGNRFTNIVKTTVHATSGMHQIFDGVTEEENNHVMFTDDTFLNTSPKNGSALLTLGALGAISSSYLAGLVTAATKEAGTGIYSVTLDHPVCLQKTNWSASGANRPVSIIFTLPTAAVASAKYVSSVTFTLYDAAGNPVNPSSNCILLIEVGTIDGYSKT